MDSVRKEDPNFQSKTLDEEPELFSHLNWVWEGFSELNYRRGVSMAGPVPVTMADLEAYCRFKHIYSPVERDRFLIYLRALDQEWMSQHYTEQQKRQEKTNSPQTNPSSLRLRQ